MRRSTLRLYSREICAMDKKEGEKIIFNFQFKKLSIELASFW